MKTTQHNADFIADFNEAMDSRQPQAASELPLPEPRGQRERSGLATCSLPVSLVHDVAALMDDCAHDSPRSVAQNLRALAAELRAHAALPIQRQPEENKAIPSTQ